MAIASELVASEIVVPFRLLSPAAPLLMVDAKINGQLLTDFIIDTGNGAFGVAISKAAAEKLALKTKAGKASGFTVDLSQTYATGIAESFELGDLRETNPRIGVLPAIDDLNERLHLTLQGNLGYPFLKRYAMTLDFKTLTLTLRNPERTRSGIPIKVAAKEPLIMIEVEANGAPLRFVLDTGASACCISKEAAERLGLKRGREGALNRSSTANSYSTKLSSLRVGDREQKEVTTMAADFVQQLSQKLKTPIDGVLGFNFWSKYRVTIDYPNRRLILDEPQ